MEQVKDSSAKKSTRWVFVDLLNVLACFAVVMLHSTLGVFIPQQRLGWVADVILQSCFIFAVPIFLMISGMNLFAYRDRYSTATFFTKRFWRVGRALIFGSIVCYLIYVVFPHSFYAADAYAANASLSDFLRRFLSNRVNDIYWFFYTIIYLYLLVPVISWAAHRKTTVRYILTLCAFTGVLLPFAVRFHLNPVYVGTSFNWALFASVPLLYFVFGYYVKTFHKVKMIHALYAVVIFSLSTAVMAYMALKSNGYFSAAGLHQSYDGYYAGITSPFAVIQACSLFVLVLALEPLLQKLPTVIIRLIRRLSAASLGVYLFHILWINWLPQDARLMRAVAFVNHYHLKPFVVYGLMVMIVILGQTGIAYAKKGLMTLIKR